MRDAKAIKYRQSQVQMKTPNRQEHIFEHTNSLDKTTQIGLA